MIRTAYLVLCGMLAPCALEAQEEKPAPLRLRLEDKHAAGTDLWIYNDINLARKEARKQGKPLFVTFRCVPCENCSGFDAEVAGGNHAVQKLAREKFISVRQVEMKGVDLSLFEFDYDLNWAAMFVHPNGTVYGRYGTQSAKGADAYNSMRSLELTMKRVLDLHAKYPGNGKELRGKRRTQKAFTALDLPGLENKEKLKRETSRKNCIHCHNIHDAQQSHAQDNETFSRSQLWRYPLPENIGLVMESDHGTRISRVLPGSAAEKAGLRATEIISHVGGQAIVSIADIQWVLHNLSDGAETIHIRCAESGEHKIATRPEWKETDISWRGSMWSIRPRLRVWTPPPNAEERRKYSIPADQDAFIVRWINKGSRGGRSARDAGLKQGDAIIELAGKPVPKTPERFNLLIKLGYKVGDKLPLTVLRNGRKKKIEIPLVE